MELEFSFQSLSSGAEIPPTVSGHGVDFPGYFLVLGKVRLLPISGFPESLAFTNSVAWPLSTLPQTHHCSYAFISFSDSETGRKTPTDRL